MNMRAILLPLLAALSLTTFSQSLFARTVTDDAGNRVTVAVQATRIADGWYAHHSLLMTLGAGDRIVATVNHAKDRPWMFKIQPSLNQALSVHGRSFESEALLTRKWMPCLSRRKMAMPPPIVRLACQRW